MEFGGVAAVEVLHHGVEPGDFLGALEEEDADAFGAFEAFEVAGGVGEVFAIDGVAVGAKVFDEVGGGVFEAGEPESAWELHGGKVGAPLR